MSANAMELEITLDFERRNRKHNAISWYLNGEYYEHQYIVNICNQKV